MNTEPKEGDLYLSKRPLYVSTVPERGTYMLPMGTKFLISKAGAALHLITLMDGTELILCDVLVYCEKL